MNKMKLYFAPFYFFQTISYDTHYAIFYYLIIKVATSNSAKMSEGSNNSLRLGEKTAAEISRIFSESSNSDDWVPKENPFTELFQLQRKPISEDDVSPSSSCRM